MTPAIRSMEEEYKRVLGWLKETQKTSVEVGVSLFWVTIELDERWYTDDGTIPRMMFSLFHKDVLFRGMIDCRYHKMPPRTLIKLMEKGVHGVVRAREVGQEW